MRGRASSARQESSSSELPGSAITARAPASSASGHTAAGTSLSAVTTSSGDRALPITSAPFPRASASATTQAIAPPSITSDSSAPIAIAWSRTSSRSGPSEPIQHTRGRVPGPGAAAALGDPGNRALRRRGDVSEGLSGSVGIAAPGRPGIGASSAAVRDAVLVMRPCWP